MAGNAGFSSLARLWSARAALDGRQRADALMRRPMRLMAADLACVRGGRRGVFRARALRSAPGEALLVTGPNGAGKSSLLRLVAGLVRLAGGQLALEGGEPDATHRRAGALSRPPGRAEAVADGRREPRLLGALSRRRPACARRRRSTAVGLGGIADAARRLSLGRPAAAAVDRAADRGRAADLAARRADLRARRRRAGDAARPDARTHLAGGGLILAATHGRSARRRDANCDSRACGAAGRRRIGRDDRPRRPASCATCGSPCASAAAR